MIPPTASGSEVQVDAPETSRCKVQVFLQRGSDPGEAVRFIQAGDEVAQVRLVACPAGGVEAQRRGRRELGPDLAVAGLSMPRQLTVRPASAPIPAAKVMCVWPGIDEHARRVDPHAQTRRAREAERHPYLKLDVEDAEDRKAGNGDIGRKIEVEEIEVWLGNVTRSPGFPAAMFIRSLGLAKLERSVVQCVQYLAEPRRGIELWVVEPPRRTDATKSMMLRARGVPQSAGSEAH